MAKNVADDVLRRMNKMLADREAEIQNLADMREAAEVEKANCETLVEAAKDKMDLCAFQDARRKAQDAQDRMELYTARIDKISAARLVTEAESDAVIDSLTAYEKDLAKEYKQEADRIVDQLRSVTYTYLNRVKDTESVIHQWTHNIHPNFRSEITYKDGSNRMDHPVPVHPGGYVGCSSAISASRFLESYGIKREEAPEA